MRPRRLVLAATFFMASAVPAPFQASAQDAYDLFLIAGQSNAEGRGSGGPEVPLGVGFEVRTGALDGFNAEPPSTPEAVPLRDPVGDSRGGSMWPAFAVRYHQLTGRGVIVIETARSSTSSVNGMSNWNWDVRDGAATGPRSLYVRALRALDDVLDSTDMLPTRAAPVRLGGVIWLQGESDARKIARGELDVAEYAASLDALLHQLRTDLDARTIGTADAPPEIFLIPIGTEREGDTPAWAAVRAAQRSACERGLCHEAYGASETLVDRGMLGNAHWNQLGLDEVGSGVAVSVAQALGVPPTSSGADPNGEALLRVWPNPTVGGFQVSTAAVVYDTLGRRVASVWAGERVEGLRPGTYAVQPMGGGEPVRVTVLR